LLALLKDVLRRTSGSGISYAAVSQADEGLYSSSLHGASIVEMTSVCERDRNTKWKDWLNEVSYNLPSVLTLC
jgi:hypothetical protein